MWMGNACIGLMNHKFFILYLFYISLFNMQIGVLSIKLIWFSEKSGITGSLEFLALLAAYPNELLVFILSWVLLFGLSIFLLYQIIILL